MSLSKEERIKISEKIVAVPAENALCDSIKDTMEIQKQEAEKKDSANRKLAQDITDNINIYQKEATNYDGNQRTELVEQDLIDSANRVLQNPFFPNDPLTPTPALTQGVWTHFLPYAGNKAIGKTYLETWDGTNGEIPSMNSLSALISTIEGFHVMERCTGQHGVEPEPEEGGGEGGGGGGGESEGTVEPFPEMQEASSSAIAIVETWKGLLEDSISIIWLDDPDPTRAAQNALAKTAAENTLVIVNEWLDLQTFDTSHGATTPDDFYAYNYLLLSPVKFRPAELQPLKDEIVARQSNLSGRMGEINTNLGIIDQNLEDGSIISRNGFYGKRYGFLDLRINVLGGSLSEVKSIERGQGAQDTLKNVNNNALDTYSDIMRVSTFRAPAIGTNVIHVMDGSFFSEGDDVYIIGDQLEEVEAKIEKKENNTIYLNKKISAKYTRDNRSRIYKMLV